MSYNAVNNFGTASECFGSAVRRGRDSATSLFLFFFFKIFLKLFFPHLETNFILFYLKFFFFQHMAIPLVAGNSCGGRGLKRPFGGPKSLLMTTILSVFQARPYS